MIASALQIVFAPASSDLRWHYEGMGKTWARLDFPVSSAWNVPVGRGGPATRIS